MMHMTFSNKPLPKTIVNIIPNSKTYSNAYNKNTENMYYMKYNMIGRLLNTKSCRSCPKY